MLSIREEIKELLKVVAQKTNGDTEKTVTDKLLCEEFTKIPPHEVKNWLDVLCSEGLIKEVTPQQNVVDFKQYSITQKGLGLPATN
jgi:hypothetical protein